ncbi:MAG: polysaccharide biosynthesis/export family protein [Cytophagaceae bacterium]|nr:polysaccharide biosynthesis/export family protein [Cytophagaceae bacterium]
MLITPKTKFWALVLIVTTFSSCSFNSNRMFKTDHSIIVDSIQRQIAYAEKNYIIQKNDYLDVRVFSSGGERLIDPDYEMSKNQGSSVFKPEPPRYLVRSDGMVALPMVGEIRLDGLTLSQADSILAIAYSKYYQNPYVISKLLNKRAIVFGPIGGKVIPLENENVNLIEVIALYGGINEQGKAYNIRLIRGDLKNPNVSIIDLSTIEGMKAANLDVQPNDIIYIESVRKLISETVRDIAPVVGLITNVLITIVLLTRK